MQTAKVHMEQSEGRFKYKICVEMKKTAQQRYEHGRHFRDVLDE